MKHCLLCSKDRKCRGMILRDLLLLLDDALCAHNSVNADAIARRLTREDMETLAKVGDAARETCWNKGFILMIAARFAQLGHDNLPPESLKAAIENVIVRMDMMSAKLPKGIKLSLADMAMDIYNEAIFLMREEGDGGFLPANILTRTLTENSRR